MTARRTLTDRREHRVLEFQHDGIGYIAGIGRFPDGSIAEVFLSTKKPGSQAASAARDAAIVASLALQHGTPIATLRHAITRLDDGAAAGPLGRVLDFVDAGAYG